MNFALKPTALAFLVATTQFAGVAYAEAPKATADITIAHASAAVKEDKAQLKEDKVALQRDENKLKADQKSLKADTKEGKMAAESKDAERIYKDRMGIKGEMKDIAADRHGSLQKKSDKVALIGEEKQMKADTMKQEADTREGRMAAESTDAERVYRDQQAIKGEKKEITADAAKLNADQRK